MKYTKEREQELVEKYEVSKSTIYRWRKLGYIPKYYENTQERLIQGMTIREAKNYTGYTIEALIGAIFLREGRLYNRVTVSYWLSGKRKPRTETIWNILEDAIKLRKENEQGHIKESVTA